MQSRVTRRQLAVATALPAAALLVASCGPLGGQDGGAGTSSKQPVKLTFEWPTYTPPKQEWAEWAMATYTQKFPHVTIEPMWNTNPTEKLKTTIAGGQPPDLGWFGVGHWTFWQAFKPVDSLMAARRMNLGDYFPKIVEAMKWRGKLLAMPMGLNTTAVFVNKGHFERVGVKLPSDDWTWDDLLTQGKRLTREEGTGLVWATQAPYYSSVWYPAYGGQWIDPDGLKATINNPATAKMLTLVRELWEKHRIAPTPDQNREIGLLPMFATGRTAAFVGGTWGLDPFRRESFEWDLAEVPSLVEGGKRLKGAFLGTEEIALVSGTPNEAAAADFAAWLCGPEHLKWAGSKGHIIPAHQKTAREAFVSPPNDPRPKNIQAFVRAANYAPPIMPHPQYTELSRVYGAAVNQWLGTEAKVTAEQALRQAQEDMQRVLDEWNRANPK